MQMGNNSRGHWFWVSPKSSFYADLNIIGMELIAKFRLKLEMSFPELD